AAQRTNDLSNGTSPGYSTAQSQPLDAAALYFIETDVGPNYPGRGGYGGYLSSEQGTRNENLLNDSNKFLVGYPLVPSAETNWSKMHATAPVDVHFTAVDPQIFQTTDILSYPGNSGGPLYVQWTNGIYYPAAIYLGEGSQTIVRAIDGDVVNLINRAEAGGSGGGNFAGGGGLTISQNYSSGSYVSGNLYLRLGPPAAVNAGAAFACPAKGYSTYTSDPTAPIPLNGGSDFTIQFRPIPGWLLPTNQIVPLDVNKDTHLT